MRAAVYPADGYIARKLISYLQRAGHEVIDWQQPGASPENAEAAWLAGLQQATAVFHVLHGHEAHARATALQLLKNAAPNGPVTFVGISSPLTWAATHAPPAAAQQAGPADISAVGSSASQQQQQGPGDGDAVSSVPPAVLTDRDTPSRRPAAAALQTYHLEQLLLRCNRPGRLVTYVVCPGILYSCGEDDSQLHQLFKTAWEGRAPLPLFGPGHNRLPTLHVLDLAAYVEGVVLQQPMGQPYLLAGDDECVTQTELVAALGQLLGNKQTRTFSGPDVLLLHPPSPLLLLDLPFSPSALPHPGEVERCCPRGLLAALPAVLGEMTSSRGLTPLRIIIRGPPAAGKTHLGQRLAQLYGLQHINAATILAELPLLDADTQKAAHAQLASKECRLSQQLMARLAQHLLARSPAAANQGWVMEGWPRSLAAARLLVASACGQGGADGRRLTGERANRRVTGVGCKDKKKPGGNATSTSSSSTGGTSAKEGAVGAAGDNASSGAASGAAAGRSRRVTVLDDSLTLSDAAVSQQNPELLPHFLIELDVPEEELLRRVRALAAAEAAAAAAAVAAAAAAADGSSSCPSGSKAAAPPAKKPASAGKKDGPGGPGGGCGVLGSHNNDKDWARRMEAYKQLVQEDAADLAAKRAAILSAVAASQAASGSPSPYDTPGRSSRPATERERGSSPNRADRATAGGAGGAGGLEGLVLPPDVKLPDHGGFVGYFIETGAKFVRICNPCDEAAMAAATAAGTNPNKAQQQQQQLSPLPVIEQQLMELIGLPHNYQGFPQPADSSTDRDPSAEPAAPQAEAAAAAAGTVPGLRFPASWDKGAAAGVAVDGSSVLPDISELLAAAEALAAEQSYRAQQRLEAAARPLTASLMGGVMPALMAGLVKVALTHPADPCQVIADELLAAAIKVESSYRDPYDDPVYAIQLAKVEAKAAREAARATAAAAKAAREAAARAGALEADAAAAASSPTASSYSSFSPRSTNASGQPGPQDPTSPRSGVAAAAASPTRPGSAVSGSKAAGGKAGAAVRTSVPPSGSSRSVKPAASVRAR